MPAAQSRARRGSRGTCHDCRRTGSAPACKATDLSVAQAVVTKRRDLSRHRDLGHLAAAALCDPLEGIAQRPGVARACWAASTRAQRKAREPYFEMWPGRALPSELRTVGVSPAQAQSLRALGKHETSPISAIPPRPC